MGRIFKRGNKWYVDHKIADQRVREVVGTSKRVAQMKLQEIEAKLLLGELVAPAPKIDIQDSIDEFLENYEKTSKPRTYARYRSVMAKISKAVLWVLHVISAMIKYGEIIRTPDLTTLTVQQGISARFARFLLCNIRHVSI